MNKILQSVFILFSLLTILTSCGNSDYIRNEDGLIYRIIKTGNGDLIKPGTFLEVHQTIEMDDTVFFSSFGKIPTYGFFDSLNSPSHDFLDILPKMRVGDSAIVIRSIDTLAKRGVISFNNRFKKGTTLKVTIKVLAVFNSEAASDEERLKKNEIFSKGEVAEIEQYLSAKGVKNYLKTDKGVFIVVDKEGNGPKADSGLVVSVNYTGTLMDGQKFDSNLDSAFGHLTPFNFRVGNHEVIEGWDIGIRELKAGSKAHLYIPSLLGYGIQGSPPKIPPYSHLIFDIEVLGVKPFVPDTTGSVNQGKPVPGH